MRGMTCFCDFSYGQVMHLTQMRLTQLKSINNCFTIRLFSSFLVCVQHTRTTGHQPNWQKTTRLLFLFSSFLVITLSTYALLFFIFLFVCRCQVFSLSLSLSMCGCVLIVITFLISCLFISSSLQLLLLLLLRHIPFVYSCIVGIVCLM